MELFKELWTAFNDIHFEEVGHKYTDSYGTKFTSVTTFIKNFEPDKDWDMIAERASKKAGGKYFQQKGKDTFPAASIAFCVSASASPVTGSPCVSWNFRTAASVSSP